MNHPPAKPDSAHRPLRRWLLRIHLYGGLLCAPYLVIFGVSSLHFNHRFPFLEPRANPVQWHAALAIPSQPDKDRMAEDVRDRLGLIGWTVPWKTRWTAGRDLEFDLERPGKSYTIRTHAADGTVEVNERRKGFWAVVNSLHALMEVPNSGWASHWGTYTEVSTAFVAYASFSGLYLWLKAGRERRAGLIAAMAAACATVFMILFVILRG